jgi:Salmonella virulence plasmid 65kDa B protein
MDRDTAGRVSDAASKDGGSSPDRSSGAVPQINLPKGGGALRGIGEKFAANPVTGTGSLTVPIATSPGRSGFEPQLSLSYDSGSGNGEFGLGWSLSLPSITRRTDKGLPRYKDADESDIFILSEAEDLVPVLVQDASGAWTRESVPPRDGYTITPYRPRVEGLFARIELDAPERRRHLLAFDLQRQYHDILRPDDCKPDRRSKQSRPRFLVAHQPIAGRQRQRYCLLLPS